ncbi:replication initiation protein [Massilia genomosp. 1]|uniref:RepB family plasmid replication initiator protein n=1 Tax=Massilia genomosp. 1 TaxID=2609280 RepID=A0ABX0N8Y8_9BURK|nr:replication initiation protein [Massilia genomosp. 1]NHZ66624.1 RepB family plasmid replication initiator protein [Massilia genomosp. 1]
MNIDEKSLTVRQANSLIEASYKIPSVGEGRLIRMLIAQIKPTDEDFRTYKIAVSDFAKFFGLTGGSAYDLIDKAAESLAHRPITIRTGKSWLHTNWLSSAEHIEGSGYVELCFDKKLKPYLLQLKGYYKDYSLDKIINFKSGYSIRLFEILKANEFKADAKGNFKRSFEYDELREMLGIEKNEYPLFADVRRNVIETAVKEINANPDITIIKVDYPKTGRKVSHVVFNCERARQTQLDFDDPLPKFEEVEQKKEHPEDVRELISMGIEENTAYKWRKKYGAKQIARNIAYTRAMQKSNKIRDSLSGYLARAIAEDIASGWEQEEQKKVDKRKTQEQAEKLKEEDEERKREESKQKTQMLLSEFHALPENEQEAIRRIFEKQAVPITLGMWNREKERNKTPELDKKLLVTFALFYETYQANLQLPV